MASEERMIPAAFRLHGAEDAGRSAGLVAAGAKPLAGGMSLIPMMKLRLAAPEHLVDLGRLKELNYIREEGGRFTSARPPRITTWRARRWCAGSVRCWPRPRRASATCRCATSAPSAAASAHADPSADYPAALQALEAKIVIEELEGERTVSAADFFVDTFTTALEAGEIVRE